jgi:hypothetical protein
MRNAQTVNLKRSFGRVTHKFDRNFCDRIHAGLSANGRRGVDNAKKERHEFFNGYEIGLGRNIGQDPSANNANVSQPGVFKNLRDVAGEHLFKKKTIARLKGNLAVMENDRIGINHER